MRYIPRTSDEAVKKATGKTWREWFALLDEAGAKKLKHIEIARLLHQKYLGGGRSAHAPDVAKSGGWWSQMVTVEYERSRGLRAVNQSPAGYSVSVHATFDIPVKRLFTAWRTLARKERLAEKTVKPNNAIRYRYEKDGPRYIVMFASKGPRKSRLGFGAVHLAKASDVGRQRKKWRKILDVLGRMLQR